MPRKEAFVEVPGSNRELLPASRAVGTPAPDEPLKVTILVRRPVQPPEVPELGSVVLSHEQFSQRYGASLADIDRIVRFATSHGLQTVEINGPARTVKIAGPLHTVCQAFSVDLQLYEANGIQYRGRVGPVLVPQSLDGVIVGVFGLDNRPAVRPLFRAEATEIELQPLAGSIPGPSFTPPQLAALYNFPQGDGTGEVIGLIELGGGFQMADLSIYFNSLGLSTPNIDTVSVNGGKNSPNPADNNSRTNPDFEVTGDMEVAGAIAPGVRLVVYFVDGTSDKDLLDVVNAAIHDDNNRPSVISISWGWAEDPQTLQYTQAIEQAFIDAVWLGVTICCASGDNGSTDGISDGKLHVLFPASVPHVLSVGGTMVTVANDTISNEVVWNNETGATGGGVSSVFPLPNWQANVGVPASPNPGQFVGRGVPDVSANADLRTGYQLFIHGRTLTGGGTSFSAPLWAALVAIMNQQAGRRFGFLNVQLYALGAGSVSFRDITTGTNDNSGGVQPLPYSANAGWDACTGLGSPDGTELLLSLLDFKVKIKNPSDECGSDPNALTPGGIAHFYAQVTGAPIGAPITYAWSVVGGATAIPPTDSWAIKVQIDQSENPVNVGIQVTVEGVQRSDTFSFVPVTMASVSEQIRQLLCEIRRVIQVNWWVDPLWDPLRDLALQPYSRPELQRIALVGERLSTLANEVLLIQSTNSKGPENEEADR